MTVSTDTERSWAQSAEDGVAATLAVDRGDC